MGQEDSIILAAFAKQQKVVNDAQAKYAFEHNKLNSWLQTLANGDKIDVKEV